MWKMMMNTKKWLGLKSTDKNFRQQLDGIFHHDKKPKKQKSKKKSDLESSSEQDDDEKGVNIPLSECGKENTMVRTPSSKKTHPFIPRSISCDEHHPPRLQQNSNRQQTEINNNANLHRRTCRYLSDSSVTVQSSSVGIQRPLSYGSRKSSKSPVSATKRLTKSQYNLSQNSDYVNRSQSLGDLTGELSFSLPKDSQQSLNSHNSSSSNLSSGSSSRTLTSSLSRTNQRMSSQKTAGGLYSHRLDKAKLTIEHHSRSFDSTNNCKKTEVSPRRLSQPSSHYASRHGSQGPSENSRTMLPVASQVKQQNHQLQFQRLEVQPQRPHPQVQQQQRIPKPSHLQNPLVSKQTNKISKANSVPQREVQAHYHDPPKPGLQLQTFCKNNVIDQHRKYGSSDCINKLKPRRSLPRVPSQNIDEKRRKFTELMKQRILLCSTGSSNNSQHADTPLDYEVSSLLSLNDLDTEENCSDKLKFKPIESAADVWKFRSLQDLSCGDMQNSKATSEWRQVVPVICNESSVSSTSTQPNARSHSSTVDSGYSTIDTEVEPYHPPAKLKTTTYYNKTEVDKKLLKYGSVDCLKANALGRNKSYIYQPGPPAKMKHVREYSTLVSAKPGSLYNVNKWEPKCLSNQTLYTRSSRKLDNPHMIQEATKSFPQNVNPRKSEAVTLNCSPIRSMPNPNHSGNKTPVSPTSESVQNASLYLLVQMYNLYPAELDFCKDRFCVSNFISLERKIIQLPVSNISGSSSPYGAGGKSIPQGRYTKLGGPGSAFRPVRGSSVGLVSMCQVSMTAIVLKTGSKSPPPSELSCIEDGDLIVEVNGVLVLDQSIRAIQKMLDNITDSLRLIMAHPKRTAASGSMSSCSDISVTDEVQALKEHIKLLSGELDRKDKFIKQINSATHNSTEAPSSRPTRSAVWLSSPSSPNQSNRQYQDDWDKNLDSIHIGEDEFVV